jgi:hypothetical protein
MSDKHLVLAIFPDEAAADAAVAGLHEWNKGGELGIGQLDLGAMGVLVVDEAGTVKQHKMGARGAGKGAGIGLVLAALTPPTLLAGIVGGAVIGHFHHRGLQLTDEDRERIAAELAGGKAAVGVLAWPSEAGMISGELTRLGGAAETHTVSEEALEAVAAAGASS